MKTIYTYNDKIKLEFDEETHSLLVNGIRNYDNVTGATSRVAKDGLIWWAADMAVKKFGWFNKNKITEEEANREWPKLAAFLEKLKKITIEDYWKLLCEARVAHQTEKDKAASIGSIVHEFAENFALGLKPELPEDERARNGALAFLKFMDEMKFKIQRPEEIVYSKKYHYWGIKDADATHKKELFCLDYKTSSGIYNEARYQTSAYLFGAEEMYQRKYAGYWIFQFGKDTGEFNSLYVPKKEAKKDFEAFLNALGIKRREAELKNGNDNPKK